MTATEIAAALAAIIESTPPVSGALRVCRPTSERRVSIGPCSSVRLGDDSQAEDWSGLHEIDREAAFLEAQQEADDERKADDENERAMCAEYWSGR